MPRKTTESLVNSFIISVSVNYQVSRMKAGNVNMVPDSDKDVRIGSGRSKVILGDNCIQRMDPGMCEL